MLPIAGHTTGTVPLKLFVVTWNVPEMVRALLFFLCFLMNGLEKTGSVNCGDCCHFYAFLYIVTKYFPL